MSLAEKPSLFGATFKVRPLPWHPQFSEWQFGFLHVLLFGESGADAAEKARNIVGNLPYELNDDDGIEIIRVDAGLMLPVSEDRRGVALAAIETARALGLGFYLVGVEPGADESQFLMR